MTLLIFNINYKLTSFKIYNANKIKKPIINENKAIASVSANPKIANLNNSSLKDEFLEIPITKAPKTVPIPTPAPANPIVANPAPINFADCKFILRVQKLFYELENYFTSRLFCWCALFLLAALYKQPKAEIWL